MNYMTPQEAAEKWKLSLRRVQYLCINNRIPGAQLLSRRWLIPVNAQKPESLRTSEAKASNSEGNYHFPILVYTNYYATKQTLNDIEQNLMEAQVFLLRNEFTKSVSLCKEILSNSPEDYIQFGAYYTLATSYVFLGLYSELLRCEQAMERIISHTESHKEDYQLILSSLRFEYALNPAPIYEINMRQLSSEALITYQYTLLMILVFNKQQETSTALLEYETICRGFEDAKITPIAISLHGILMLLCERVGNTKLQEYHAKQCCQMGHEEDFAYLLAKFSALNPGLYRSYLSEYGKEYAKKIEKIHEQNMIGWVYTFNMNKNQRINKQLSSDEYEFFLLLSNDLGNREIAKLKNMKQSEVKEAIDNLCKKKGYKTRGELVSFVKKQISMGTTKLQ